MPALVAGIHVSLLYSQDVDGRVKPGHDVDRDALAMTGLYTSPPFAVTRRK
jgi:hypothetical protein